MAAEDSRASSIVILGEYDTELWTESRCRSGMVDIFVLARSRVHIIRSNAPARGVQTPDALECES
jgi:hypothetical protein